MNIDHKLRNIQNDMNWVRDNNLEWGANSDWKEGHLIKILKEKISEQA